MFPNGVSAGTGYPVVPEPVRLASRVGATTMTLNQTLSMSPVLSLLAPAKVRLTVLRAGSVRAARSGCWPRRVMGPERVMLTCSL